jgi:hypothetical protein
LFDFGACSCSLESLADMIDFLCSLPFLKTTLAKIVRTMAIEEIVEEECWEQEEQGSDDDQVNAS